MKIINKVEKRFYEEFNSSMNLKFQPPIKKHGIILWKPDFLDLNTNIYYEVVGASQSYYKHCNKKHFDFMIKENKNIIIAVYLKRINTFLLFSYSEIQSLLRDKFYSAIQTRIYKRKYGNSTNIFRPVHLKLLETAKEKEKEKGKEVKRKNLRIASIVLGTTVKQLKELKENKYAVHAN